MSQAAWEAAVDNAVAIAEECGVTEQEFLEYVSDGLGNILPEEGESR